jgi:hypothetical protein
MKFVSYPTRLVLVIALVVSLSGAGIVGSRAAACRAVRARGSELQQRPHCCCADHCQCGPRCGSPDAPTQTDDPLLAPETNRQELANSLLPAIHVLSAGFCELPLLEQSERPAAEIAPLQSLFDQHTCLRA